MSTDTDQTVEVTAWVPPIPDSQLAIPSVAASLLPLEIIDSRRMRKVRRVVVFAMVPFLALLGGWYALTTVESALAERDLVQAEDGVRVLQQQQRAFSEVTRAQSESKAIRDQLTTLFAGDITWADLSRPLQRIAPDGVVLSDVSASKTDSGGTGQLPGGTERVVGRLVVAGTAPTKRIVASYVDRLGDVTGLANPLLTSAMSDNDKLTFSVQLDITADAVGGRYTATSGNGAGK
jgi:hypothetical protein